jgi:hypothetical protein
MRDGFAPIRDDFGERNQKVAVVPGIKSGKIC